MSRLDSVNGTKLITGFGDPEIKEDILSAEDKTLDETVKVIEAKESGEIESSDRADSKKSCPAYISVESVSEMDISAPSTNPKLRRQCQHWHWEPSCVHGTGKAHSTGSDCSKCYRAHWEHSLSQSLAWMSPG